MPASVGFKASPVDKSKPTASSKAVLSSSSLTIVSCESNPPLTAKKYKQNMTDIIRLRY